MISMVLYDKGTARLWNLRPSLTFLREIIKHSPTLFRKLIIPDHLKPFIDTSIKGFNHEFYGFYDIVIYHD
jgi:glutathionylspermidine synthase